MGREGLGARRDDGSERDDRVRAGCAAGRSPRAHARSGDAVAIASYLGTSDVFDRAMAAFAEAYADQNERDYDALKQAVDSGRVKAESGL